MIDINNNNNEDEGKSSNVKIGGRLGVELSAATSVNLVNAPDTVPDSDPGAGAGFSALANLQGVKVGSRLASVSSSVQDIEAADNTFGNSPSPVSSPGPVATNPTPNNQRYKQRRKESWDNR